MNRIFDTSRSVFTDADLKVADHVERLARDVVRGRTDDGSAYQAWDFDPADRAIVDDVSY